MHSLIRFSFKLFQEFDEEKLFQSAPCKCNCHDLVQAPDGSGDVYFKRPEK